MPDWDARYRADQHTRDSPHLLVTEFASGIPARRALDLACGTGRHALWLAERGWSVTAVDSSAVALQILSERAAEKAVKVESVLADLEQHEFFITENSYDLIVVCNYLQRDLFPAIRSGVRGDGLVIAIIAMVDDNPHVKPMNPAYLVRPGELRMEFGGWTFLHDQEGSVSSDCHRRKTAQLVAQRPLENEMHNG